MANPQLTAYVSAQLDKGVTREAITQALTGAGWMQTDVEAAVTEVMSQRSGAMNVAVTPGAAGANPTVVVSQVQPATQTAEATLTTVTATTAPVTNPATTVTPASFFATTPMTTSMGAETTEPKKSLTWLFVLVGILLALGILGGLAYAYLMNGSSNVTDLTSADAAAQELMTVQQERDQLRSDASVMADNIRSLENELSLFQTTTTAAIPVTIRGTLSTTTAGAWILTTPRNIVVTVSNGKDAGVVAALTPLKGAEVELTGTHGPVSALVKVTAVNGTAIAAPAATTTVSTAPAL